MICYKCQNNIPDYTLVCPNCGAEMSQQARYGTGHMPGGFGFGMTGGAQPMNWYRFVVSFILIFEAIQSFSSAFLYISGVLSDSELIEGLSVYTFADFGGRMRIIDIIYGVLCAALGAMALYTRSRLAKFKKNAVVCYITYLIVSVALGAAYSLVYLVLAGEKLNYIVFSMSGYITQIAYVYLNHLYFSKRKQKFVN